MNDKVTMKKNIRNRKLVDVINKQIFYATYLNINKYVKSAFRSELLVDLHNTQLATCYNILIGNGDIHKQNPIDIKINNIFYQYNDLIDKYERQGKFI